MPDTYDLTLSTQTCGADKYVTADYDTIVAHKDDVIHIINTLDGSVDAKFMVFNAGAKSGPPIVGFCDGARGRLTVPGAGTADCKVTRDSGNYQFKVTARPSHKPLDPIIIIEPKVGTSTSLLFAMASPVGGILTLAILGAVAAVSYKIGMKAARKIDG